MHTKVFVSTLRVVILKVLIKLVENVDHPEIQAHTFCYKNEECAPASWGGLCHTGKEQSPIDIPDFAIKTTFRMNKEYLSQQVHKFYGQNNGHTAQFELVPNLDELKSNLHISGGELHGEFVFAQLHFHWGEINSTEGSEHTIKGIRYPLEMHLVHYNKKYTSLKTALESHSPDALAVMAVLFKLGKHNVDLDPIVEALNLLEAPGKVTEFKIDLQIATLYPEKSRKFARYMGSLTTPTCDEKVVWTVFMYPEQVSLDQMQKFWDIRDQEGTSSFNFRPTQPLHSRKISFYDAHEFEAEPFVSNSKTNNFLGFRDEI